MSPLLLAGLLTGLASLLLLVYFLVRQSIKNNELKSVVNKLNNDLGLLRDSQQGLGLQLLELELQLHSLLKLQATTDSAAQGGTLNQIASRLRGGASSAEIISTLGVSEAEVKLVKTIVTNVDRAVGSRTQNAQPGVAPQTTLSGDEGEPVL